MSPGTRRVPARRDAYFRVYDVVFRWLHASGVSVLDNSTPVIGRESVHYLVHFASLPFIQQVTTLAAPTWQT